MKAKLLSFLLLPGLLACMHEASHTTGEQLVVEGWIEAGKPPYVYLSSSLVPQEGLTSFDALQDHLLRWAVVTVSDGEEEVLLMGLQTNRHFPPYVYTTNRMVGEVGKTYTLTVKVNGKTATASATIPPPRPIGSLEALPFYEGSEDYLLKATIRDNPETHDFYRMFVKIEKADSSFVPSEFTLIDDAFAVGDFSVMVHPGRSIARSERHPGFRSGETVQVKLCNMQEPMFHIWEYLEEQLQLATFSVFPLDENLPGNVEGALGYFAGYGADVQKTVIP